MENKYTKPELFLIAFFKMLFYTENTSKDTGLFSMMTSMVFIFWIYIFNANEMPLEYYFLIPYSICILFCTIDLSILRSSLAFKNKPSRFLTLFVPLYLYCRCNYLPISGIFKYRNTLWWFLSLFCFYLRVHTYIK